MLIGTEVTLIESVLNGSGEEFLAGTVYKIIGLEKSDDGEFSGYSLLSEQGRVLKGIKEEQVQENRG